MSLTSSNRPSWESVANTTCWGPSPDLLSQKPCSGDSLVQHLSVKWLLHADTGWLLSSDLIQMPALQKGPHLTILSSCCPSHTLLMLFHFIQSHWHYSEPILAVSSFVLWFIVSFPISSPQPQPQPPPH